MPAGRSPVPGTKNGTTLAGQVADKAAEDANSKQDQKELRGAFDAFVGKVFYGQLLAEMRKSVGKPAYFHGGRGEEVFQAQLDQVLGERMAQSNASQFSDAMFQLFTQSRS